MPPPELDLPTPPGIAHARLVERFGDPDKAVRAYRRALWDDLRHRRLRGLRGFFRWAVGRSLYSNGIVAWIVAALARQRWLLGRLRPRPLRDWIITRACGVLLLRHNWRKLGEFADWAVRHRRMDDGSPNPSDLYYRSQARRYQLDPDGASEDATRAVAALATDVRDPERLAGALYEAGSAAIYHADFDRALRYAFDLRFRRGRFAIPRWQAWGAWLEAIARSHQGDVEGTREPLAAAEDRFTAEKRRDALMDVRTAQRLAARVALATIGDFDERVLYDPADERRRLRYLDDLNLAMADFAIARGDLEEAERRLTRVRHDPAAPISEAWARLGWAELLRLRGDDDAAEEFAALTTFAGDRNATWLQVQSIIGLTMCGDRRADVEWQHLQEHWTGAVGRSPQEFALGDPRVLWLFTV
jgi:hypothetical protein